jgi:hypothetical protein
MAEFDPLTSSRNQQKKKYVGLLEDCAVVVIK